jgi:hypothetical protein
MTDVYYLCRVKHHHYYCCWSYQYIFIGYLIAIRQSVYWLLRIIYRDRTFSICLRLRFHDIKFKEDPMENEILYEKDFIPLAVAYAIFYHICYI